MATNRLNEEWHRANRMPPRATLDQRVAWHEEHAKHCGCRDMPESVRQEIERRREAAAHHSKVT